VQASAGRADDLFCFCQLINYLHELLELAVQSGDLVLQPVDFSLQMVYLESGCHQADDDDYRKDCDHSPR
jgi:hypothetical protein